MVILMTAQNVDAEKQTDEKFSSHRQDAYIYTHLYSLKHINILSHINTDRMRMHTSRTKQTFQPD